MVPPLGSGRREADQLLLLLLRQNGCVVPKGVSSVAHMTSDMVIEVVASLIPAIDGSPPLPDAFAARGLHPAERLRTCKKIASRVKDAGYSELLSPHQLLYPGEGGTRRLLLALISMLPPDGAPPHSSRYTASAEHAPVPGTIREQRLLTAHDLLSGSSRTVDGSPADHASGDEHGGSGPPVPSSSSLPLTSARMEVGNTGVERSDIGQGSDNEGEEVVAEAPPGPSGKQRVEDNERGEDDAADDESETVAEVAAETAATTEIEADVRMKEQNAGKTLAHMGPREFHVTDVEVEGGEAESVADDVEASGMDHTLPSARQISPGNSAGVQATSIRVPADVVKILPESTGPINGWQGVGSGQRSEILDGDNEAEEGGGDDENIFQQELSVSATKVEHHGEVPGNGPPAPELSSNVLVGGEQRADEESIRAGGNHRPKVDEEGLGVGELDNFCAQDEGSKDERTVEVGSEVLPATPEISSHLSRYSQEDGTVIAPIDAADRATELSAIESVTAIASDDAIRKRSGDSCSSGSVQRMSIHLPQVDAPVAQGLESADEEDLVKEADAEAEPLIAEADDGDEQGNEKPKNGVVRTMDRTVEEGFPCHSVVNIAEVGSPAVGSQGEEEAQERDTVRGVEAGTAGPQNEDDADDNAVAEEEGDDDMIFLQFAVEAQEVELQRLLTEKDAVSAAADELEEEVRRLGVLTAERERECRYSAKALEHLPRAGDGKAELQRQCSAAEARILAARSAFDSLRKPLEEAVRAQREELARRKVRCRSLLSEIRSKCQECENMARSESFLRAAALEMEAWETQGHSNEPFLIGGTDVEGTPSWEDRDEDEEDARRRRAGALLKADLDARIGSLSEEALGQKQEVAISVSEVLDSRRKTNAAWEGLGRTEALAEKKLFAVAKEASTGGGSKERGKDFIQAYKRLHVLQDLFSRLVEAVAEAGKHEEECHVVEDGTEVLLSEGEAAHSELLMRDLRRVQSDVFALERRLEDALEEERQLRQAFEADRQMQEEQKLLQQALLAAETAEKQQDEQNEAPERWHESDNGSRRGIVLSDDDSAEDWSLGRDGEDGASKEADEVGAMPQPEEGSLENDQSVDFVGEDEEDNFWQQIGIPQVERIGVVESEDPEEKPETG